MELCLKLLALALILALLGVGLLYVLPVAFFAVEPEGAELSLTGGLPQNRANVLLLGLDVQRQGRQRSDAILIASIANGDIRLASVLRDTVVDIPGHGSAKLNAAYAYGGPELVMQTLNRSLKLNLMHYVAVDFSAFARLIDALGGVELELTDAEADAVNHLLDGARDRLAALGYAATGVDGGGRVRLSGIQALAYARIRKLDSDFGRTHRQRKLLSAILAKLRASLANPILLTRLVRELFASIETNMSPFQLVSLGLKALAADSLPQLRLPVDGSFSDDQSALRDIDLNANIAALQAFLYDMPGSR